MTNTYSYEHTHTSIKAILSSIELWWLRYEATHVDGARVGDCPLCVKYAEGLRVDTQCRQCPIFVKVGAVGCIDTPYYAADVARNYWEGLTEYRFVSVSEVDIARGLWRQAAMKEIRFLTSLLPRDYLEILR